MFKVTEYTCDPTLAGAKELESWAMNGVGLAKASARNTSKHGIYAAVYAEDGEQIAGYLDGEQVQGY